MGKPTKGCSRCGGTGVMSNFPTLSAQDAYRKAYGEEHPMVGKKVSPPCSVCFPHDWISWVRRLVLGVVVGAALDLMLNQGDVTRAVFSLINGEVV